MQNAGWARVIAAFVSINPFVLALYWSTEQCKATPSIGFSFFCFNKSNLSIFIKVYAATFLPNLTSITCKRDGFFNFSPFPTLLADAQIVQNGTSSQNHPQNPRPLYNLLCIFTGTLPNKLPKPPPKPRLALCSSRFLPIQKSPYYGKTMLVTTYAMAGFCVLPPPYTKLTTTHKKRFSRDCTKTRTTGKISEPVSPAHLYPCHCTKTFCVRPIP